MRRVGRALLGAYLGLFAVWARDGRHVREEQRLLGERFVLEGQRLRVREGPRSGQCGIVLTRAVLCAEGVRGSVTIGGAGLYLQV